MQAEIGNSRRDFLKTGGAVAGGLIISFYLPGNVRGAATAAGGSFAPNAFIRITPDDTVTLVMHKAEMGQGIYTSLPMLIAEELEVDLEQIQVEFAPVDPAYRHPQWGQQGTGGSTSMRSSAEQLRTAGATAREMLIAAAAKRWNVAPAACEARSGKVIHKPSGRTASFGELSEAAANMPPPAEVALKSPGEFRVLGTSPKRLDTPAKISGQAQFGLDVYVPGMLTALVARPPVFGGLVRKFDASAAKRIKGVQDVVEIEIGVAVVADSFWAAKRGRDALEIEWDEGPNAGASTPDLHRKYAGIVGNPGRVAHQQGDTKAAMDAAVKTVEAIYELPYLAHATMEPLNSVADVRPDRCDIWTGTQAPEAHRNRAVELTGLPQEAVQVHSTFLGGGFGRRSSQKLGFVDDAVLLSKKIGKPVKVVWTREDDTHGGYYRPMNFSRFSAGLDAKGMPVAWSNTLVGGSLVQSLGMKTLGPDEVDRAAVEGAREIPYAIPNQLIDYHPVDDGVPILWWRSVGHSHNAFFVESFIDELAAAAGQDPFEYRRRLMQDFPRELGVLELAAAKADWGSELPAGQARGIAVHKLYGSYVAEVAEVSIESDGRPRVHRVVCAVDCGTALNPEGVKAQMESGIVYGLSAALYGRISLKNGRVEQSNFHDYPVLRIDEMPKVETHILNSGEALGGAGEPATAPIAPAVCNAIYALTGKRIRSLPIGKLS